LAFNPTGRVETLAHDRPPTAEANIATAAASGMLQGRRFLVTGGARGLGAAIVRTFADHGANGLIVDLKAPEDVGLPWPFTAADVTDEGAMRAATEAYVSAHGPFDGVVAAAGIVPSWQSPEELNLADFDRTMAVNVRGTVVTVKSVAATLPPGSTIVAIGSLNSWKGDPNIVSYVASKHAVLGVVRSTALALGRRGIRVNAVAPGPVATEALLSRIDSRASSTGLDRDASLARAAELTALGRLATEQDIADAVLFLSSPLSAAISGQLLPVDGGIL
jgi:3alpha(or 20beta)-hydroxysteroid dehydrogenase